jgi:hypothetical protein
MSSSDDEEFSTTLTSALKQDLEQVKSKRGRNKSKLSDNGGRKAKKGYDQVGLDEKGEPVFYKFKKGRNANKMTEARLREERRYNPLLELLGELFPNAFYTVQLSLNELRVISFRGED